MSRNIADLTDEFRPLVEEVLSKLSQGGIELTPFYTLRDPWEQAKLWRQSRTKQEVLQKIDEFHKGDAHFLAECIISVGPQSGRWATNCPPGFSWHQWGEAIDCFLKINNQAEWNGNHPYYVKYHMEARSVGLYPISLNNDVYHIQFRNVSLNKLKSLNEINQEMKHKFS